MTITFELTDQAFVTELPIDSAAFDIDLPCQGCGGDGIVEWDDRLQGPCPICQANPDN